MKCEESNRCVICQQCCAMEIPFIAGMPEENKEALLRHSIHRNLEPGSIVFNEGESIDAIYIIIEGKVKLASYDAEGYERIVSIFASGDTIWEGILTEGSAFPYSCVCITPARVCVLEKEGLVAALNDAATALRVIALLSRKLHDANVRNMILSTTDPKQRIAAFLKYRNERDREETINLKLDDIAGSLHLRPETVSRKLRELIDDGLIERSGRSSIRILDFEGLEELGQVNG